VPQGGNTGLVGGGVPRGGEVVLSLRRLDDVEPPDAAGTLVAGATRPAQASQYSAGAHSERPPGRRPPSHRREQEGAVCDWRSVVAGASGR